MRVCLQMNSGKITWSECTSTGDEEPPAFIGVPVAIPGKGFGQIVFDYFGVMHTPNDNSYLMYVERKSDVSH